MELSTFTKDNEQHDSGVDVISTTEIDHSRHDVQCRFANASGNFFVADDQHNTVSVIKEQTSGSAARVSIYKKHFSSILLVLALFLVLAVMQTPITLFFTDEADEKSFPIFDQDLESCSVCFAYKLQMLYNFYHLAMD